MGNNILPAAAFSKKNGCTSALKNLNQELGESIFDFTGLPAWNATTLTGLIGDNPPMHLRLLKKFLVSAQSQVDTIHSAAKAKDTATLHKVAHTLKSAARTVGAIQLGELCHEIEEAGKAGNLQHCAILTEQLDDIFKSAAEKINQILN